MNTTDKGQSWLNRVAPLPGANEESWFGEQALRITNQYPQYLNTQGTSQ